MPGGTSSSASPWLWQLRHTTERRSERRPTVTEARHQSQRGRSPRGAPSPTGTDATSPGDAASASRRGAAAGACEAALRGAFGRACTVGANSRSSCAAGGRQRDGCLPVPGSADDRAGYRSAQDLLPSVSVSFSGSCPADSENSRWKMPTIISYSSLQPTLFGEAFKAFLKDKVRKRVVEHARRLSSTRW